ncbi:hypothetical protein IQ254_17125 [Nodosilinea sp. LEGE 07088]|uniref:hypothetical protein n=1 Tax=Nodosilinea sp. LEGE 07088 TaxID=2777968 RepID=UPI00187F611D|nr:hypothetical protein [Nodosilinea sp. LEGE 07088]MBE9138893.1 hypothetical protein [Nodosilinea sp. LEGE 07088]
MADDRDPRIRLQLDLSPEQPGLLDGLDSWLQLGLISDQQVQNLCQTHLSCGLPEAAVVAEPAAALALTEKALDPLETTVAAGAMPDFVPASDPPRPSPTQQRRTPARSPAATSRWLNRLMGELSVVWLLGLGVFLVVLSSAVLAATQWARFNAAGQYLVLLTYTLVFWAAGLWCRQRPNLQLTAKTLQMTTLLLLPLNFWALDGLGIWPGAGFLVAAIAAILLTLAALQVLRQQESTPLEQANALGLAYLHIGWGLDPVPILAVYAGVLGSTAAMVYGQRRQSPGRRWSAIVISAALGLLLMRGLTVAAPSAWGQFGLALGLYGATWVWLGQHRPPTGPAAANPELSRDRTARWGVTLGRGLLLGGWLLAIADWRFQAFGVSLLGLGLRIQALGKLRRRRDLLVAYGIAVQLAFVGWVLLPTPLRQTLLTPLARWSSTGDSNWALLGISLLPYVVGMVALADRWFRRGLPQLGRFGDGIALGSSAMLTLLSVASGPVLVVNLIAAAITALVATRRRSPLAQWRIVVTYGLVLVSAVAAVENRWPALAIAGWLGVIVGLATLALVLSKALSGLWGRSAWLYGVGLSALVYALLWGALVDPDFRTGVSLWGLVMPVVLALIGRHPASVLTTGIALVFTLGSPWTRLLGLGTATALTGANSVVYKRPVVAFLAVGFALGWVYSSLYDWGLDFPGQLADWGLVTGGLMAVLWVVWRWLAANAEGETPSLVALYRVTCDRWGHILAIGVLALSTIAISLYYLGWRAPQPSIVAVLATFLLALGLRYGGNLSPLAIYLAGWGIELLLAGLLVAQYPDPVTLAVPTLGLGAIALGLSAALVANRPQVVAPLQTLTLGYAGLALALRLYTATAWTGWLVVGAALIILQVERRTRSALGRWLALGLLSVGWYELVIYQLSQGPGGAAADALLVLAGVAALIMAVYRLAAGQLDRTLGLPQVELIVAAHLHWLIGSLLLLGGGIATGFGPATLGWLGLAIAAALLLYALSQGRLGATDAVQHAWVYAGLLELIGWFALARSLFASLSVFDPWWGVVACGVAVPLYWLPWVDQGWPQRPWRVMAVAVPLGITLLTGGGDHIPTLWVLAGFYGWLAWHSGKIRVSYLSAACATWAIWAWLDTHALRDSLAWVLPLGLVLIYIAQVDPAFKNPERKEQRHWLRGVASAIILLTALGAERWTGLPVGAMALGAIAAGLLLRTRAWLYVGTGIFLLNAFNQLVLLNAAFPFIKWIVGILVGIMLIWTAADVERRRDQWLQLTQRWGQDLDNWQ